MRVITRNASTVPTAMTTLSPSPLLGVGEAPVWEPWDDWVEDLFGLLPPVPAACGLAGSAAVAGDGSGLWLAGGGEVWAGGSGRGRDGE